MTKTKQQRLDEINNATKKRKKVNKVDGIGVALAVVLAWLLSQFNIDVPVEVQTAIGAVVLAVSHRVGGCHETDR